MSILATDAKSWRWIPFEIEMIKIMWNVHKIWLLEKSKFWLKLGKCNYKPWNECACMKRETLNGDTLIG